MIEFVQGFGKVVSKNIKYVNDFAFYDSKKSTDHGDASVEMTGLGDCEDMALFFSRVWRLFLRVYKYMAPVQSQIYKFGKQLEEYKPYVYICYVKLSSSPRPIFHSTMMLVGPTDSPPISFEVTNPSKSMPVNKEFFQWHVESFFLLDANFICRISSMDLRTISLDALASSSGVRNL
jgi:hypothetical protein